MTTEITVQVAASTDDGMQRPTTPELTGTNVRVLGAADVCGFRWDGVTVPQGSTIDYAYFQPYCHDTFRDTGVFTINGEDADDAATFTTANNNISGRTATTATVAVNVTNLITGSAGFYTLADVKTIVQEIVDRAGWASGNAIVMRWYGITSGDFNVRAYDNSASEGAKLVIGYTAAASGAAKKRKLRIGTQQGVQLGF